MGFAEGFELEVEFWLEFFSSPSGEVWLGYIFDSDLKFEFGFSILITLH